MKKINKLFWLLIFVLINTSCKNPKNHSDLSPDTVKPDSSQTEMSYRIIFPDTVKLNKEYDGYIEYKGAFDSVTTKMFGDKFKRRVVLEIDSISGFSANKKFYDNKQSGYRFLALNNHKIPLLDFSFHSLGTFEMEYNLEDSYLLNYSNLDSLEEISSSIKIKMKVEVME